jgi:uncharacterized protein YjbI with pentapeptide repeats
MTQTTAGTTTYQTLHDDRGNVIYHHPDPLSCFPDLLRECSAAGIQYTWVDFSVLPRDCLAYQVVHDLDLTNMTLSNMNLAGTVFRRCGLRHVKVSKCMLQGTRFDHCDMNNIYIHYPPIMQDVSFIRCGMEHAVIRGASINGLRADHCRMIGALITDVSVGDITLSGCDLEDVCFRRAHFCSASTATQFRNCSLYSAGFEECSGMKSINFQNSIGNGREVCTVQNPLYPVVFTRTHIHIGCQRRTIYDWMHMTSTDIDRMYAKDAAVQNWRQIRLLLKNFITMHFQLMGWEIDWE